MEEEVFHGVLLGFLNQQCIAPFEVLAPNLRPHEKPGVHSDVAANAEDIDAGACQTSCLLKLVFKQSVKQLLYERTRRRQMRQLVLKAAQVPGIAEEGRDAARNHIPLLESGYLFLNAFPPARRIEGRKLIGIEVRFVSERALDITHVTPVFPGGKAHPHSVSQVPSS